MGILKAGRPSGRTEEHIKSVVEQMNKEELDARLTVKMTKAEHFKYKSFAFNRQINLSDMTREALQEYVEKHGG